MSEDTRHSVSFQDDPTSEELDASDHRDNRECDQAHAEEDQEIVLYYSRIESDRLAQQQAYDHAHRNADGSIRGWRPQPLPVLKPVTRRCVVPTIPPPLSA